MLVQRCLFQKTIVFQSGFYITEVVSKDYLGKWILRLSTKTFVEWPSQLRCVNKSFSFEIASRYENGHQREHFERRHKKSFIERINRSVYQWKEANFPIELRQECILTIAQLNSYSAVINKCRDSVSGILIEDIYFREALKCSKSVSRQSY